jgi:hypothetical protein
LQIWSSLDTGPDGSGNPTLGKTWVKNIQPNPITPRIKPGLVIAQGYNNANTTYAYLLGGCLPQTTVNVPYNDVYYTQGRSNQSRWIQLTPAAPFQARWAFGISNYTFANRVNGIMIVGGWYFNPGVGAAWNDVWLWDVSGGIQASSWTQLLPTVTSFPPSGYLTLIYQANNMLIVGGTGVGGLFLSQGQYGAPMLGLLCCICRRILTPPLVSVV